MALRAFKRRTRAGPDAGADGARGAGDDVRPPGLQVVHDDVYSDWEAVYRDNVDRVYGLMFAKVGNRPDAEDLTAEVFLAALGPLRVSATVGEVRAYLRATARTVLAGYWRRHFGLEVTAFTEALDLPDREDSDPRAADSAEPGSASRLAEEVLAGLPEQYRQVLRLRFLQGYSVRETATALGVSVSNAKVLQHRALRRAAQRSEEATG